MTGKIFISLYYIFKGLATDWLVSFKTNKKPPYFPFGYASSSWSFLNDPMMCLWNLVLLSQLSQCFKVGQLCNLPFQTHHYFLLAISKSWMPSLRVRDFAFWVMVIFAGFSLSPLIQYTTISVEKATVKIRAYWLWWSRAHSRNKDPVFI